MDHLVQFTISIDDNHIAQMVDNREEIIDKAADKLAEKLSRTKAVKEAAAKRVSEEAL